MAKKNESCKTLQLPIIGAASISIRNTPLGLASLMALVSIVFSSSSAFAQFDTGTPIQATPEEREAAIKALMEGAPEDSQIPNEPELDYDQAIKALEKTKEHSSSVVNWGEPRRVLVPKGADPNAFIQAEMIKVPEVDGKFIDGPKTVNSANITPIAADPVAARALPGDMGQMGGYGVSPEAAQMTLAAPPPLAASQSAPPEVQPPAPQAAVQPVQPAQTALPTFAQTAPQGIPAGFGAVQSAVVAQPGYPATQSAYPVAQPGHPAAQQVAPGYPAAQLGYPAMPNGYPVQPGYVPQGYQAQGFSQPASRPQSTMVTREWSTKDWAVPSKTPATTPSTPAAQPGSPAKLSGPASKNPHALALVLVTPDVMAGDNSPVTPEDSVALYNKAVKLHLSGQLDEAIEAYGAAIAANPELGPAFCNRGLIFNQKRLYTKAIDEFHKALAIDPKDAITYNGMGAALRAQKDMPGAIKNWQTAITLDPKLATAHYNLGTAYELQKDYEKAIESYEDAISHDSKLGEAYYRKGLLLIKLDKIDEAKESLSKSLKASSSSATAEYSASARAKLAQLEAAEGRPH